jgi:hypothetical protein
MSVEVVPITHADVPMVADFLHANLNERIPWEQACSGEPWEVEAPNRGFMLRDGQHVVGTLLALYSERFIAGRTERFCNLGSWCVLPQYRSRSLSLLTAILAQENYHFTVLSPNQSSQEILPWMKFRFLDTSAAFIPNLPWPTMPGLTTITSDPDTIESTLTGSERRLYHDHAQTLATRHLVLIRGNEHCYLMYREFRFGDVPVFAVVLHVSNPDVFHRALVPLTRHLLVRRRLVATIAELRVIERRPRLSFKLNDWPKLYRSADLTPDRIDYLYSELQCVPWRRSTFPGRCLATIRTELRSLFSAHPSGHTNDEKVPRSI